MGNKILYVDDEAVWGMTVSTFLKLSGYPVVTATNGTEAMVRADEGSLAAIILDVTLPGEDCAQLLKSLKTKQPGVPIILYTGLDPEQEAVQRLVKLGAEYYLRKGNLRDLLKCLENLSRKLSHIDRRPRLVPAQTGAEQLV